MKISAVGIFITALVFSYFLAPLGSHNGLQILNISKAIAAGFEDPAVRAEAMKKVSAKKVPGEYCSSLGGNKEAFQIFCGPDMLPLKRRFCESKYKEVMAENTCRDPYAPAAAMMRTEKCEALRSGYKALCGSNMDPLDKADCKKTAKSMKKNKCR